MALIKYCRNLRKRLKEDEDFQMRFYTFMILRSFAIFLIIAILVKNFEFIYYGILMFPLLILVYKYHKRIHLHFPVFILITLFFLAHLAGELISVGGVVLYDVGLGLITYDNLVHILGSFVLVLVAYSMIHTHVIDKKKNDTYLFLLLFFMSLGLAVVVEMISFFANIFFNRINDVAFYVNVDDLLMNFLGSLIASLVVVGYHRKKFFNRFIGGKLTVVKKKKKKNG